VRIDGVAVAERGEQASLRYEGFLDDRYVAALRLSAGSTARVYYLLRAVSPGSYQVPPPLVEDMYRPQLRGVGKAEPASLEVVQP
jgi:Large extracellular alpha-helical protein